MDICRNVGDNDGLYTGPETCRVEFEQGFHQAGGVPLLLELGIGGEVLEFAGSVGIGDDHSHADGRVADGEDMHIPGFQIAIDHGFARVREEKKRKVLFLAGRDGLEGGHCRSSKKVDGVSAREGKEKRLPFRKGRRVRKGGAAYRAGRSRRAFRSPSSGRIGCLTPEPANLRRRDAFRGSCGFGPLQGRGR